MNIHSHQKPEVTRVIDHPPFAVDATFTASLLNPERFGNTRESQRGVTFIDDNDKSHFLDHFELRDRALRFARGLTDKGIKPGDLVLIGLPTSMEYVIAYCGTVLCGAVSCTVPLGGEFGGPRNIILSIVNRFSPRLIIINSNQASLFADAVDRTVSFEQIFDNAEPLDESAVFAATPDSDMHVQLTSGSTSDPKGAILSHANVIANVVAMAKAIDGDPMTDQGVIWLPMFHDMGLICMLMAIYHKSSIVLFTPFSFLRNPLQWLRRIAQYKASLSAAPTFAFAYCVRRYRKEAMEGLDLSHWRRAFIGGELVTMEVLNKFGEVFAQHGFSPDALYPCYGMAEVTLAATLPMANEEAGILRRHRFLSCDLIEADTAYAERVARPASDDDNRQLTVVGAGMALEGMQIEVRDENGELCPDRKIGEIFLAGTSVIKSYLNFGPATCDGTWIKTGDLGYKVGGELFVLGRIKDLIILRGRNYYPHEFEETMETHRRVRKNSVVAFGVNDVESGTERIVIVVEPDGYTNLPELTMDLQAILRVHFGFGAHEICYVSAGSLPRTTSGKLRRSECKNLYCADQLKRRDQPVAEVELA